MIEVNVHEAETELSELVDKALSGEKVIIAEDAAHAVRLVPVGHEESPEFPNEVLAAMDDRELNHYLG